MCVTIGFCQVSMEQHYIRGDVDSYCCFSVTISHLIFMCVSKHVRQSVNTAIFQAARAAKKSVFTSIMDNRVKPLKHLAYEQLMKRDLGTWTHHASDQDTVILDQVTSNPAESTMHMVGARVSIVSLFYVYSCANRCPKYYGRSFTVFIHISTYRQGIVTGELLCYLMCAYSLKVGC